MNTVVYTGGGGRFGNQLLRSAHWLAWTLAQRCSARVVNLAFWPYARLIDAWSERPGCVFPCSDSRAARAVDVIAGSRMWSPARRLERLSSHLLRWSCRTGSGFGGVQYIELDDRAGERLDLDAFRTTSPVTLCRGWRFEAWEALASFEDRVRDCLQPTAGLVGVHQERFRARTSEYDAVVGLLARRGDYASWAEGRYLFAWGDYRDWAQQLSAAFAGRRVGVVVASDERIPPIVASLRDVILAEGSVNAGGSWFDSFLDLAACDLVVSPPSTFSACAAFLGRTPLLPLVEAGQRLDPSTALSGGLSAAHRDEHFRRAVR